MKKLYLMFVAMSTGYCGEDATDVFLTEHLDPLHHENEDIACSMAYDNCESFHDMDGEEDEPEYEGCCTLYNPDDHDCQRSGGGSFLEEYPTAKKDEIGYFVEM